MRQIHEGSSIRKLWNYSEGYNPATYFFIFSYFRDVGPEIVWEHFEISSVEVYEAN